MSNVGDETLIIWQQIHGYALLNSWCAPDLHVCAAYPRRRGVVLDKSKFLSQVVFHVRRVVEDNKS